jgi:hypothetical protein
LSHKHRFVWFAAANSASTTLRLEFERPLYEATAALVAEVDRRVLDDYLGFVFLRDPLERCLSAYQETSIRTDTVELDGPLDFRRMPPGLDRFSVFLDAIESSGPWDDHVAPQSDVIPVDHVDFYGDVENLEVELAWILNRVGLDAPDLPARENSRLRRRQAVTYDDLLVEASDLTPDLMRRVRRLYRADERLCKARITERELDSDYRIVDRRSDVLVVSFGGRGEGYNFIPLTERIGADGLFFRDSADDWYLSGVRGISRRFEEICAFIGRVIQVRPRSHVLFLGHSSGGYAALRFAHALEPDSCIALAPQTHAVTSDAPPPALYPDAIRQKPPDGILDIGELYRSEPIGTRVEVHACTSERDNPPSSYFWDDESHLAALAAISGIRVVRHPCHYHPVAYHLDGTGELDRIVRAVL